jgi:Apea-like HEPN
VFDDLIPICGEHFLRYVLALEDDATLSDLSPTSAQRRAIEFLSDLVASHPDDEAWSFRHYGELTSLCRQAEGDEPSTANRLRIFCGGKLPEVPTSGDDTLDGLLSVARDLWPGLLIPTLGKRSSLDWDSVRVGIHGHPGLVELGRAFLTDEDLGRFFPNGPSPDELTPSDLVTRITSAFASSGYEDISSTQFVALLGHQILCARTWALAESRTESWQAFSDSLPQVLSALRGLARGETVRVPRLVAFSGLEIPDGTAITVAQGELRAPQTADHVLLPVTTEATAILVTTYPLCLAKLKQYPPDLESARKAVEPATHEAQREIDLTRLAVLLAAPGDAPWGLVETSSLIVDPTPLSRATQRQPSKPVPTQVKLDDGAERIEGWSARLAERHPSELDIAMRRVLSAASDRNDPLAGFIDSIIAWENCFGTEAETTFRITAAMAALLEPYSAEDRLALQADLKRLYAKRSRIVHGASQPHGPEADQLRDEALKAATDCLRGLYRDRPELLTLKSEERSRRLVIG